MTKKSKYKSFLLMNLGCILLAAGVYFFKIPNGFATGGVTGIGTILGNITFVSPASWIWILNIGLLLLGFIFLGRQNGIKTVYCSMFYSAITYVLEIVLPISSPLTNQPFLELVYAMLLTAIDSALIFNSDASSGGTDIAALILKKFTSIDVGKALLAVDFIVATSSFVVFGIQIGLFSLLGLFAKAFIVDSRSRIKEIDPHAFIIVTTSSEIIGRGFRSV